MTTIFKFAEPTDCIVVELAPDRGRIETFNSDATIDYKMNIGASTPNVILNIDDQIFEAEDVDELISFLETVRDRLREIS